MFMKNVLGVLGILGGGAVALPFWAEFAGRLPAGRYPVIFLAAIYLGPPLIAAGVTSFIGFMIGAMIDAPADRRKAKSGSKSYEGETLFNEGKYAEAIAALTEAITLNPRADVALFNRGLAYAKLDNTAAALADFNASLRINPNNARGHYQSATMHWRMDATEQAVAGYSEAIRLDPRSVAAYNCRGYLLMARGDPNAAVRDFDQSLRLDPGNEFATEHRNTAMAQIAGGGPT